MCRLMWLIVSQVSLKISSFFFIFFSSDCIFSIHLSSSSLILSTASLNLLLSCSSESFFSVTFLFHSQIYICFLKFLFILWWNIVIALYVLKICLPLDVWMYFIIAALKFFCKVQRLSPLQGNFYCLHFFLWMGILSSVFAYLILFC